jgi:hypothetical protein
MLPHVKKKLNGNGKNSPMVVKIKRGKERLIMGMERWLLGMENQS